MVSSRLLPALAFCGTALMLNCVADVWAQYRADRYWPRDHGTGLLADSSSPLPDLGFEILPYISSDVRGVRIPDVCMSVCVLGALAMIFIKFDFDKATIVLKRTLILGAIGYTGRAISVPLTQLPNPDASCKAVMDWDHPIISVFLVPFGLAHTCADVFYSGHSISVTLATMVWVDYASSFGWRLFGLLWGLLTLVVIIGTHFHYTIDVVYGVVVTFTAWRIYHHAIKVPAVMLNSRFLMYWEADAFPMLVKAVQQATVPSPRADLRIRLGPTGHMSTQSTIEDSLLSAECCKVDNDPFLGVVHLDFSEDPRVLWGLRVPEDIDCGMGRYSSLS